MPFPGSGKMREPIVAYAPDGAEAGKGSGFDGVTPGRKSGSRTEQRRNESMKSDAPITVFRDCEAVMIPSGDKLKLAAGSRVWVTQALGGSFTVMTDRGFMADELVDRRQRPPGDDGRGHDGAGRQLLADRQVTTQPQDGRLQQQAESARQRRQPFHPLGRGLAAG